MRGTTAVGQAYGVKGVPANFWIDRTGRIVRVDLGFDEGKLPEMESMIRRLIGP